ncbi:muconolactone Delta-isomerase family protein [Sorangium sp. So ce269]
MLFLLRVRLTKPEKMTNQEFYGLWLKEAEAATQAMTAGTIKQLWKVPGLPEIIGVVDVESPDALDAALLGLPLWSHGYSHLVTDIQVTPLRPYEHWHEDLKKLAAH